jgi:uncharacterized protein YndB with AHSA1/START domain
MTEDRVIVRCAMPAAPEDVFDVLTRADRLVWWLCDEARSDVCEGGRIVASWRDVDGMVHRQGTWIELSRPHIAHLRWDDVPADTGAGDDLKFAIAAAEDGSMVTISSPFPPGLEHTSPVTVRDATRDSWAQCLEELGELLKREG